jgi:hypothetical protein
MYSGKTIFAQLMDVVPKYEFQKIVKRHEGNLRVRKLTCRVRKNKQTLSI